MPTAAEAIDLLARTQKMLADSNLRLHKFASYRKEVMEAFPISDHAKGLKNLDLENDPAPIQRSLGLSWDLKRDMFTFRVADSEKPFTHRGVLATVNSLFDPLGFVAPSTSRENSCYESYQMRLLAGIPPFPRKRKNNGTPGENRCMILHSWRSPDHMLQPPSLQP